jgi:threonine aldolase
MKRGFGSDNHSGVHPELLKAINAANFFHAPSYGTDEFTQKAEKLFKDSFGSQAEVFFVFNGTAANVLSLKTMMQSYESALVSSCSHLNVDECGAPEFFTGGKLIPLAHQNGKISLPNIERAIIRLGDQHFSQCKVVSLTQPTEYGTVYTPDEIKTISSFAKKKNIFLHMDGARFCNAAYFLNCTFKELTTDLGIDILSFGGTKNGFLFGEAIVILNPSLVKNFKYLRKQAAQLPSKTRFIAAQFERYLQDQLWHQIAAHECQMAEILYQNLKTIKQVEITQNRQSNAVFAKFPKAWIKPLREEHFFYVWDEHSFECRLMTSWDTEEKDIHEFIKNVKGLI